MLQKQIHIPWLHKDYSYIDFFRKAYENETQHARKMIRLHQLRVFEANKDFWTGSLRSLNHLIQIGSPNLELKEARCEIYKISISFEPKREFLCFINYEPLINLSLICLSDEEKCVEFIKTLHLKFFDYGSVKSILNYKDLFSKLRHC